MANTPNLDMAQMQAAQSQKEVTFNAALTIIDAAAGVVEITIANGTNNLTEVQSDAALIVLKGALTTPATVNISSAVLKLCWVLQITTGGQMVTCISGLGSTTLPLNQVCPVWPSATLTNGVGQA